ncbi:MAG: 50S ribosomal protein L20 [Chloroflexota bacterium]
MARVKTGPYRRQHHKKVLKMTKGQFGTRHRLFRRANEALLKSMWYAYRDRRTRKRDLRRLWIARINAAARLNGTSYSKLVHGMKENRIALNRKMLADLAARDPKAFAAVVAKAQTPAD